METRCFVCRKNIGEGEDYTSINKGIYSQEGDQEWVALIFHDLCWQKMRQHAPPQLVPLFDAEV